CGCCVLQQTGPTQLFSLSLRAALPIWLARRWLVLRDGIGRRRGVCRRRSIRGGRGLAPLRTAGSERDDRDERGDRDAGTDHVDRSEEHTSELQSRENLVCRLLLEKKK